MRYDELILDNARRIAIDAHYGQMYGDVPYTKHLESVVSVCNYFGLGSEIAAACWLHDVLEDCTPKWNNAIALDFEGRIYQAVWGVTDEPGKNRKERKAKTYAKTAANPDAVLVKLCDRIANVHSCKINNPSLFKMYANKQPEFMEKLRVIERGGKFEEMGNHLQKMFE